MGIIKYSMGFLFCLALTLPYPTEAQDSLAFELSYDVHRDHPAIRMTMDKLEAATALKDLNKNFRNSWIKKYERVEITTTHQGKIMKATSANKTLSAQQKEHMQTADPGSIINVNIQYLPENNLKHNDTKEIDFSFIVDPEINAQFPGGQDNLRQYLKENALDKIEELPFRKYQLSAVKFTIDEDGIVSNPHLFWPSEDQQTDAILLEAICNMPNWKPATYDNGLQVQQEFVFTIGDMESCVSNMFNIGEERPSEID